ncbi:MAG: hypothetical protein M3365_04725 [Gemmatimonadota bacterium]|nr:hypothetical protein [Gemmatimonadota bacterium]
MRQPCLFAVLLLAASLAARESSAQAVAIDPSARLKQVLPADVAQRVLARIADARANQLPAEALENRALKFAAKGVAPLDIERSLNEQAERMGTARSAIAGARRSQPRGDEIEAGAEAIRKGADGAAIAQLAKSAPRRPLAIPLFVIGSLADRGLPSDEALQRVLDRLKSNATDAELERLPGEVPARATGGNAYGRDKVQPNRGADKKPRAAGRPATSGKPAGVPGNGGARVKPAPVKKPRV